MTIRSQHDGSGTGVPFTTICMLWEGWRLQLAPESKLNFAPIDVPISGLVLFSSFQYSKPPPLLMPCTIQ